jgi:hypothetical protein
MTMNIKTAIRHYIRNIRPIHRAELSWFSGHATLAEAVQDAALAVNERGQRYRHQQRIPEATRSASCEVLLSALDQIATCADFEALLTLIEDKVDGIAKAGELYCYDTALRVAAKLELRPQKVYLHAGTRIGAKALGLNYRARALEITELPEELRELPADEIEDILCIYKDQLGKPGGSSPIDFDL